MLDIAQLVPAVGSSATPAAVLSPDSKSIFLAWKGEGTDQAVYWTRTTGVAPIGPENQLVFLPQTRVPNVATTDSPALAVFKGVIYMTWKGEQGDDSIYWTTFDGTVWKPQTKIPGITTRIAPAMAATPHAILLVWQSDSDTTLYWAGSSDGATFTDLGKLTDGTSQMGSSTTPAMTAQGNNIYMTFKGATSTEIWWTKCTWNPSTVITGSAAPSEWQGFAWGVQKKIPTKAPGLTLFGPAIAWDGKNITVAWNSAILPKTAFFTRLVDEATNAWAFQTPHFCIASAARLVTVATPSAVFLLTNFMFGASSASSIFYAPLNPAKLYTFGFASFKINQLRSGWGTSIIGGKSSDTDYASFSISINSLPPLTLNASLGDCNGGDTYAPSLVFPNIALLDTDVVAVSYYVLNSSQGTSPGEAAVNAVTSTLVKAYFAAVKYFTDVSVDGILTTTQEKAAFIGAEIGAYTIPLFGAAIGAIAGWLLGGSFGILFPDCDGPVAAAIHSFTGSELRSLTAASIWLSSEDNPGVTSASGCGSNSDYTVNWFIEAS